MRYYGDELVDKSTCGQWRADLKLCLLESECCRKLKKTPRECLRNPEGLVSEDCLALKYSFFQCKRSLLDMRTRFRGIRK